VGDFSTRRFSLFSPFSGSLRSPFFVLAGGNVLFSLDYPEGCQRLRDYDDVLEKEQVQLDYQQERCF
jgi:hypothetical protein